MIRARPRLLLSLALAFPALIGVRLPAAEPAPASLSSGAYHGTWRSGDETTGQLRLTFSRGADLQWKAAAVFTYEGADVPTETKAFKVEGSRLELTFSWNVQGVTASSTLKGEIQGTSLAGTYESTVNEAASSGRWSVTLRTAQP